MTAAQLEHATKHFGETAAVVDASFAVEEGEVVALLGPNGAGKTTSIALLLGLRRPDGGSARLFGRDPRRAETRRLVGATPQELMFPLTLRVTEVVELVRAHYPHPAPLAEVLDRFALGSLARRQTGGLSGGERRRLAVALAFAGGAPLAVLDEPTAGLDTGARRAVWDAVREQGRGGGAVLLTTHHLDEAEALASRVVVIERGRIVADGSVAAIKAAAGLTRIRFRAPPTATLGGPLQRDGDHLLLLARDAGAAVAQLVRDGVPLVDLEVRPVTLEEALDAMRGGP
ncbi:MAG TPA: ABC transporter ATP-binding protein [Gaiellaceae bacterium]